MKISQGILVLLSLSQASAFTSVPSIGVIRKTTSLFMTDAVEEAPPAAKEAAPAKPPASGLSIPQVRTRINALTAENFSATLSEIEPFLVNEAGRTFLSKSLNKIADSAKKAGVEVPANYAKDAATTAKRRSKQDAFIQQKEAEKVEAAAEAAAAAEEAAAVVEEPPAEEALAEEAPEVVEA